MPSSSKPVAENSAPAAVRFVSELFLLGGFGSLGYWLGSNLVVSALLLVAFAGVVTLIWGSFIAPKARFRLADPGRLCIEVALVAIAALGLVLSGHWLFAVVLVACYLAGTKHGRAGG